METPGISKSNFENLLKLTKFMLAIINSEAKEYLFFSRIHKNLAAQRVSLQVTDLYPVFLHFS